MKSFLLRWRLVLVLVAVLGIATLLLGASPAAAKTIRIPMDNYNIACNILSQTTWVSADGKILHVRDRVITGAVESDGNYHEGTTYIVSNANIDLTTGYGNYWGTLEIYPYAYPGGHWAGHWVMHVNEGQNGGIARLQGYDELDGLLTKSELMTLPPDQLPAYAHLCGGNLPIAGTHAVGFVMDLGGE